MKPDKVATPPQPKHGKLWIETTDNGYVLMKATEPGHYGSNIVASFESFASLTQWLKKNMVQR